MAKTLSTMIPLNASAPSFKLPDVVSGRVFELNDFKPSKALVVMFICNHCPYVKHIQSRIAELAQEYEMRGVRFVAINSNDTKAYPEDSPEKMKELAKNLNFSFPYLFDESQEVARAYKAACTPDFFVFNAELKCAYRGQFDDSRPGNGVPVTGKSLSQALDALVEGRQVDSNQKASLGCNIKWKN